MPSLQYLLVASLLTGCMIGDDYEEDWDDEVAYAGGGNTIGVRIVSHNIEKRPAVLERVIQHAFDVKAHGIALQEVCPKEVEWLRANLGSRWTISENPGKKPAITGCDLPDGTHDKPSSVAIWTGATSGKTTNHPVLAEPAAAPGGMACVKFERGGVPVHLCSAHLISGDWKDPVTGVVHDGATIRLAQTTRIKQIARDNWFAGSKNHFGIIAGDFNGAPQNAALDKIYDDALGGTGDFTEYNRSGTSRQGQDTSHADGDGEPFSRKIDYVFFSTNRAPLDGPPVDIQATASDHDMITSVARMRK